MPPRLRHRGVEVVAFPPLACAARHWHIDVADSHSSLVLAVPIAIDDNSGIAHVLEHVLLTGSDDPQQEGLFFRIRSASSAVDMNAVTTSHYMAVHFTCEDEGEFLRLLQQFANALLIAEWSGQQVRREIAVVKNEMQGVFADPTQQLAIRTAAAFFDQGCQQFNPGGHPDLVSKIDLSALKRFWTQYFTPENLQVISYGDIDPEKIRQQLDQQFDSRFSGERSGLADRRLIEPTRRIVEVPLSDQELRSIGLFLPVDAKNGYADFEIVLLQQLIDRFSEAIRQQLGATGVGLSHGPEIRQHEGVHFLFCIANNSSAFSKKTLTQLLVKAVSRVVGQLDGDQLDQVRQTACYLWLTAGDRKHGAGVALSLELLDHIRFENPGKIGGDGGLTFDQTMGQYQLKEAWLGLVERLSDINRIDRKIDDPGKAVGCSVVAQKQTEIPPGTAKNRSAQVKASVHQSRGLMVHHYQLARPLIASCKWTVPIAWPSSIGELQYCAAQLRAAVPQAAVQIDSKRVRGRPDPQCFLSARLCGGEPAVIEGLMDLLAGPANTSSNSETSAGVSLAPALPPHQLAIYRAAGCLSSVARSRLILGGDPVAAEAVFPGSLADQDSFDGLGQSPQAVFLATSSRFLLPAGFTGVSAANGDWWQQSDLNQTIAGAFDDFESSPSDHIPGQLNHCSRVWRLPDSLAMDPDILAAACLFAALATSVCLEPVVRGQRHAYASSADVDVDLGVLAMFSFRDPHYEETDKTFLQSFDQVINGGFDSGDFSNARRRSLARLSDKGSIDQRCEATFDRAVCGFDADYHRQLKSSIVDCSRAHFVKQLGALFSEVTTSAYALVGRDG